MKNIQNDIPSLIGLLASTSLAVVSGGLLNPTLSNIGAGLTANLLTGFTPDKIKKWFIDVHPNELNHHIKKLFVKSINEALHNISFLFSKTNANEEEKNQARDLIKQLQKNLPDMLLNNNQIKLDEAQVKYFLYEKNKEHEICHLIENQLDEFFEKQKDKFNINTFKSFFAENLPGQIKLCFGEGLKDPVNRNAWIAFQRMLIEEMRDDIKQIADTQQSIKDDLSDLKFEKSGFSEEQMTEIHKLIHLLNDKKAVEAKFISEINQILESTENKANEIIRITTKTQLTIDELKRVFRSKEIIIRDIKSNTLIIEIPPHEIKEIGKSYEEFKKIIDDKYFYMYNGRTSPIDELTEESFDYLTEKIKVNHILLQRLCLLMKESHPDLQRLHKMGIDNGQQNPDFFNRCRAIITNKLLGIIIPDIWSLYEMNKDTEEYRREYVGKCFLIVKRLIDLSVFCCLSYIYENITIVDNNIKELIADVLGIKFLEHEIELLYKLLNIQYSNEFRLLNELQSLKDYFDYTGKLSILCRELQNLTKNKNLNLFDCYRAEKVLTEFLTDFAFFTNYNMISAKMVEYHHMKESSSVYIQFRKAIGFSQEKTNNIVVSEDTFTHAVLLVDKQNTNRYINLYPFVIDRNALKQNAKQKISLIAFFSFFSNPNLGYEILQYEPDKETTERDDSILTYKSIPENEDKYSDDNIENYNINCVLNSFKRIRARLTI